MPAPQRQNALAAAHAEDNAALGKHDGDRSGFRIHTPLHAETGSVAVVFTKGGVILGVGGGEGVLTLRGRHYPFTVSGMSMGATLRSSATKLVGQALNLRGPASIESTYSAVGVGGALAGGARSVRFRKTKCV